MRAAPLQPVAGLSLRDALGLGDARAVALVGAGGKSSLLFALARAFATSGERVLVTTTTRMATAELRGQVVAECNPAALLARAAVLLSDGHPGHLVAATPDPAAVGKVRGLDPGAVDAVVAAGLFDRVLVEADGAARRPLKAPALHEPVIPACCDAVVTVAGLWGLGRPLDDETVFRSARWAALAGIEPGVPVDARQLAALLVHPEGMFRGTPPGAHRAVFLNGADSAQCRAAARDVLAVLEGGAADCIDYLAAGCLEPRQEVDYAVRFDRFQDPVAGGPVTG